MSKNYPLATLESAYMSRKAKVFIAFPRSQVAGVDLGSIRGPSWCSPEYEGAVFQPPNSGRPEYLGTSRADLLTLRAWFDRIGWSQNTPDTVGIPNWLGINWQELTKLNLSRLV